MYRQVNDFLADWKNASSSAISVLEALQDDKLDTAVVEGHNTLGWLGWHVTTALSFFGNLIGIELKVPGDSNTVPKTAKEIQDAYKQMSSQLTQIVKETYNDDKINEEVDHFGEMMPRGAVLRMMINHQTHHLGQMTVLLRQAGLKVPGIMGPTKEEQEK